MAGGAPNSDTSGGALQDAAFGLDRWLMARALKYARFGLGSVAPNPAVGAVVFDPVAQVVVGAGWTQPSGRPHGEPVALAVAGGRARGATMAVTLEPCVHHGRSPPCTDAIIAAGLKRVIYAIGDPDPRVAGRGADTLRAAGIAVERADPDQADVAHWITRGHILRVTERRPFVQIKVAVGPDGRVARGGTAGAAGPTWVTGTTARALGHVLRAEADAILVGRGTVRDDDPDLRCRLPGLSWRSPLRVVLGGDAIADDRRLAQTVGARGLGAASGGVGQLGPDVIHYRSAAVVATERPLSTDCAGVIETVASVEVGGKIWLPAVMEDLVARGVTRLLVEGGPTVWAAFAKARLVDEVVVFHAGDGAGRVPGDRLEDVARVYVPGVGLRIVDVRAVGRDTVARLRLSPSVA